MTYQEMVEAKKHIEALELDLRRYDDWLCVDEYLSLEDLVSAIEAIEKQIPKKCRHNLPDLGHKYKYCPFCGQRLDRSDEE